MSDFQECIIIPLAMFQQCNFRQGQEKTKETGSSSILYNTSLPADVKLKLYQQEKRLKPSVISKTKRPVEPPPPASDIKSILQEITTTNVSKATSILAKILQHKSVISWNEKLEVTINGIYYPNSDIIELLRYVLGDKVVTSALDVPLAATEFRNALKELGVLATWLKKEFKPSIARSQIGQGWIKF